MLFRVVVLIAVLLVAAFGCNGPRYKIIPVEGKISFDDGSPLPTGTRLIFAPADGNVGVATGVTMQDGFFKLKHANGSFGAEECSYTIALIAPVDDDGTFFNLVHPAYADGQFAAQVKDGMEPLKFTVVKKKY